MNWDTIYPIAAKVPEIDNFKIKIFSFVIDSDIEITAYVKLEI